MSANPFEADLARLIEGKRVVFTKSIKLLMEEHVDRRPEPPTLPRISFEVGGAWDEYDRIESNYQRMTRKLVKEVDERIAEFALLSLADSHRRGVKVEYRGSSTRIYLSEEVPHLAVQTQFDNTPITPINQGDQP